jgi:hypothetical protein
MVGNRHVEAGGAAPIAMSVTLSRPSVSVL